MERRIIPGQLQHADRVLPLLLPYVSEEMVILDFGNGSGAVAHRLAEESGARVTGVDVAQNSLFPIPAVSYDGATLPFRDNTFDLVYSVFVIHHCPDAEAAVREMCRVSKGRMLLVEDVWTNWINRFWLYLFHVIFDLFMLLMTLLGKATWSSFFRYQFKDDPGWKACLEKLGLRLVHCQDVILQAGYPVKHRLYVVDKDEDEDEIDSNDDDLTHDQCSGNRIG